jgi:hypothetical protein
MATELPSNGFIKRDSNAYAVTSAKVHNVPEVHADRVFANDFVPTSPSETLTASGTLSLASEVSFLDTTGGARAFTLAHGTYTGQRKVIVHAAGANNAVVTPDPLLGAVTTITTATAGLSYTLTWLNGSWVITSIGRAAGITVA